MGKIRTACLSDRRSAVIKNEKTRDCLKIFAECFLMYIIAFLPYTLLSGGIYLANGDYRVQVVQFHQHMRRMYAEGFPLWDWISGLGMNFPAGYSFYSLYSPYTLLLNLFPEKLLPYVTYPVEASKFGIAAVTAYLYASRYTRKNSSAYICGILYAFSGIQAYNTIFHFSDFTSIFPLMPLFMDDLLKEKKRGAFAVILAVGGIINYYFLFGACVFLLIYFIVKTVCKEYRFTMRLFGRLAFETLSGIGICSAVLLPAAFMLSSNSRASLSAADLNFVSYEQTGTIWRIIQSMFMPPDPNSQGFIFWGKQLNLASVSLLIPLFLIIGTAVTIKKERRSFHVILLAVCAVFAVLPILNSSFSAFSGRYYARWFYMPLLMMITMTGKYIDDFNETDIKRELIAAGCAVGFLIAAGIVTIIQRYNEIDFSLYIGYWFFEMMYPVMCLLCLVYLNYVYKPRKKAVSPKMLQRVTAVFSLIPLLYMNFFYVSKWNFREPKWFPATNYNNFVPIEIHDDNFFRVFESEVSNLNVPLAHGYASVDFYHSLVSGEETSFYARLGEYRESNREQNMFNYALGSFLSVGYELVFNSLKYNGEDYSVFDVPPTRKGFIPYDDQNMYMVYKNENFIPMGFTYDYYLNTADFEPLDVTKYEIINKVITFNSEVPMSEGGEYDTSSLTKDEKEKLLLKAIWLDSELIEKYSGILEPLPKELFEDTSDETYIKDCENRRKTAAYEFIPDKTGFTAKIDLPKDNLVFWSIPFDKGFTAYVDGEKTEIERVFDGLTAVYVPAGDHTIRFDYTVRGLKAGLIVSAGSAALLTVYCISAAVISSHRRKQRSAAEYSQKR